MENPRRFRGIRRGGRPLCWELKRSVLILSIFNDRYGRPEYHIRIYYVPNLEDLVLAEQQNMLHQQQKIKRTGKTAF
jgi:hypothetical protein